MADVMAMDVDTGLSKQSSSSVFSRLSCNDNSKNKKPFFTRHMQDTATAASTKCCCKFWIKDRECPYQKNKNKNCKFLHSHLTPTISHCISFLTKLRGHNLAIKGIAFPANSNKLYSGAMDKKIVAWDADTGKGTDIPVQEEVGCMIHHGSCVFLAIPGSVKAFDTISSTEQTLATPGTKINALQVAENQLFAGCQDGHILSWKFNDINKSFEPITSFKGHAQAVTSLAYNATSRMLFSGSLDGTINVWNTVNFQSIQHMTDHTSPVTCLLCSNNYLISCSLDGTIKVQDVSSAANFKTTHSYSENYGFLTMYGMHDPSGNPVLAASCMDGSVRLYDLPSFKERGRLFSSDVVRVCQIGPGGLFITGDNSGELKVWKWENCSG